MSSEMKYEVFIVGRAEKDLHDLPQDIRHAVIGAISRLAQNPRPRGCKKVIGVPKGWRVQVRRNYRILYVVDDQARQVTVYRVKHRKEVYRDI